ncbi:hypothetical protein FOA52_012849 [Chlamydomonas sp. UWO 241]|nr:hypothetical protein FOA52_012849 [Chlamydomonas sp. UWO 241]
MSSGDAAGPGPGSGPQGEELTMLTGSNAIKVILLGDSAVGKSKLVERYLLDNYKPHQLSTYALTLYRHNYQEDDGKTVPIDIWDTAGQERFNSMHSSYYYRANACIMVFDVTRKVTYKNLEQWYDELQENCKGIPTIVIANKIDVDYKVTSKSFNFAAKVLDLLGEISVDARKKLEDAVAVFSSTQYQSKSTAAQQRLQ